LLCAGASAAIGSVRIMPEASPAAIACCRLVNPRVIMAPVLLADAFGAYGKQWTLRRDAGWVKNNCALSKSLH